MVRMKEPKCLFDFGVRPRSTPGLVQASLPSPSAPLLVRRKKARLLSVDPSCHTLQSQVEQLTTIWMCVLLPVLPSQSQPHHWSLVLGQFLCERSLRRTWVYPSLERHYVWFGANTCAFPSGICQITAPSTYSTIW